ncbi:MAG: YfhO family protein [Oscillospiraceae bacterium]|nr:YfhO family protein [Oscillospiraceae bacterium]
MNILESKNKLSAALKAFIIGTLLMVIVLIPNIIKNGGYFIYGGDYLYQQVPFNIHAVETVRSHTIGWDWLTDLGSSFIGSYSFYLLGSPFFWLMSLFPSGFCAALMPFIIAVKTGTASMTSYIYIRRYTKTDTAAHMGALLYAFSGFQLFNIVFNHFHDVTALFPLLILSFDMLVKENKKGFFAVMTAIMAITNYFFFYGIVVFIILYYIIRCVSKSFEFSFKNFLNIAFEAITGVMISAVLLVPSVLEVISNPRVSGIINGTDAVNYSDNSIIPKIIQSMFIIPDTPSRAQLFQSELNSNNWASVSLFIPFFAIIGVASYICKNKKSWITRLLEICFIAACIPLFNSMFYMFNAVYYARWFYMPILFMSIATVICIEDQTDLMPGIKIQAAGLVVLALTGLLPRSLKSGDSWVGNEFAESGDTSETIKAAAMSGVPETFYRNVGLGVLCVLILYYIIKKHNKDLLKKLFICVMASIMVVSVIYLEIASQRLTVDNYKQNVIEYTPELDDDGTFFRINNLNYTAKNYNLVWDLNSIQMFHSIVPGSVSDFYKETTGKHRMMESNYDETQYPLFGLLSVKYVFNGSTGDDLNVEFYPSELVDGYELYDKQNCMYIYENKHFVPMGFMFNYSISQSRLDEYLDSHEFKDSAQKYTYKQLIMMRALVLSDDDAYRYSTVLPEIPDEMLDDLDEQSFYKDCDERAETSCSEFTYDENGFKASIQSDQDQLVFFSVPYHKGWSASVNGEKASVITADYGLTAVKVSKGDNIVEFTFETPGLSAGIYITIAGCLIFLIYLVINVINRKYKVQFGVIDDKKLKKAADFFMSDSYSRLLYIILFAISVAVPVVIIFCHENWRDEGQSWLMAKDLSIAGLLNDAKYEGHPVLWHLILMPFAKAGLPFTTMNFISAAICAVGSYFLIFKVRLNNLFKTLMVLTPFALYWFPVVSRSYSLCFMFICILMYLYPIRKKHLILYGIIIALTFNTHILMAGLCGGLVILELIDIIKGIRMTKKADFKELICMSIAALGALFVFVLLMNSMSANGQVKAKTDLTEIIDNVLSLNLLNLCVNFLNTYKAASIVIISACLAFVVILVLLIEHPRAFIVYISGIGFIVAVSLFVYGASQQKAALIFPAAALTSVILQTEKPKKKRNMKSGSTAVPTDKIFNTINCLLLIINIIGVGGSKLYYDIQYTFSYAESVAQYLSENISEESTLICVPDEMTAAVKSYAPSYKFWSIFENKEISFTTWTNERKKNFDMFEDQLESIEGETDAETMDMKLDLICSLIPENIRQNDFYIILESQYIDSDISRYTGEMNYELIYDYREHDSTKKSFCDERFYIFRVR